MAVSGHVITERFVMGTQRVVIGSFVNTTDEEGDVPTSLARVTTFEAISATVADRDSSIWRNSTDATGEYDANPTQPSLGGTVHFGTGGSGLDSSGATYRYMAAGV